MKPIGQTVLRLVLLLAAYNGLIALFPSAQNRKFYLSWWQENYIKIQGYLYESGPADVVFCGSSMSANLPAAAFGFPSRNLGLVGYSSLTGLECIRRSGRMPRAVVVEANWLDRTANPALISDNFQPGIEGLRRHWPGLRTANDPVDVAATLVDRHILRLDPRQIWERPGVDPGMFRERLRHNVEDENSYADYAVMEGSVRKVGRLIAELKASGVRVFLQELPVDPALQGTRKHAALKMDIAREIDAADYGWVPPYPRPDELQTIDGYHLTAESLPKYAAFLNQFLTGVLQEKK